MNKKILLVEPAYESKYPPLGLMKLSTYHRMIKKDDVTFVKGCSYKVRDEYWDRVYITTLFTYTWKETVKTINFYRETLFSFARKIYVGGILASLLPNELFNATGIQPVVGLLNNPEKIGQDDAVIIDDLPPDYEMLNQVEFKYAYTDAYLGYATRGCPRKCEFCAVNTFEPHFVPYINIKKMIDMISAQSGPKQNLLLMDNNVLCSKELDHIIDDLKAAGFSKGATFGKTKRKRIVDFNQGLDARLLDANKMKRLSEIPLEPMRVAFDDIKLKDSYLKAVRLAHRYGQKDMSNYILYNYKDKPDDFYERLKINIDLNEEFRQANLSGKGEKTTIYSFPMRYIPLDAKDRNVDTGNPHWNKRYLRGVQVILSVIKGPVMPGTQFFEQAFGRTAEEFKEILLMPDEFIRNRVKPDWHKIRNYTKRLMPYVKEWKNTYSKLGPKELTELIRILTDNSFLKIKKGYLETQNKKLRKLLEAHIESKTIVSSYKRTGADK
jgi:hypothetical protein